jgi:hypothetical protein
MSSQNPPASVSSIIQESTHPQEVSALNKVMWFGIINIVGIVASWVMAIYIYGAVFSSISSLGLGTNPTPAEVSTALGPIFKDMMLLVPATVIVELVALVVLTLAFRGLTKVDRERFSIPSSLMIFMLVGVAVQGVGFIPLLNSISDLVAQIPATPTTTLPSAFFSSLSSLIFDYMLLAIAGIVAVTGEIGGLILGLWRVGSRYDRTVIKIGAIFEVIPLLNIVAPILVLIGAHEAKSQTVYT